MIASDTELTATLERIRHLQQQLALLRKAETNLVNYQLSSVGQRLHRRNRQNATCGS